MGAECRLISIVGAGLLVLGSCGSKDDGAKNKPTPTPPPAPRQVEAPPPIRKDPAQVLQEARDAATKVRAIAYAAAVGRAGSDTPAHRGNVTAVRAEAGGWLLNIKGGSDRSEKQAAGNEPTDGASEQDPKAEPAASGENPIEIGYDGANVRSIRNEDKVVFEKVVLEWEDLLEFLDGQGAKALLAWEIMGEQPLEAASNATFEGQETIGGELCDIVQIPIGESAEGAPAKCVRYSFAVSDRLPRRIVRSDGDAPILTLTELVTDSDVPGAVYALPTPSGFRIRDPDAGKPRDVVSNVKSKILGDPENRVEMSMSPLKIGDEAPAWELKDASGKAVSLADFKGKIVVMDFWGTWCGWCVKAMPAIEQVHQKYKHKGVVVLGMNTENDPNADPAGFMRRNNYTYGLILKAETITQKYKVFGFPTLYVIDGTGKVIGAESGYSPDLAEKLSKIIDEASPKT